MFRISTNYQYYSYQSSVLSAQSKLFEAQQTVTTGKKPDLFSNDPAGASYVIKASALKSATAQYDKNLRSAKDYLQGSESEIGDSKDLLQSAYSIAVQGATVTTDQTARAGMADQIGQLQKRLLDLANTQGQSGQYIFAGTKNDSAPFAATPNITYTGDAGSINIETGPGQTMTVNSQSQQLFTDAYNALEGLKNNLTGGNVSGISGVDVAAIQKSMDAMNLERGKIGNKLQSVADLGTANQKRTDDLTGKISDVEDVDLSQAITALQLASTAYQAALQSTTMAEKLSLMDFIH